MSNDPFWIKVREQIADLRSAGSAPDVLRILSPENNPYRIDNPQWDGQDPGANGFFGGSGGDDTVWDALDDAGWEQVWSEPGGIYYAMRAPDGSIITYCEGDIYGRDKRS